MNRLSQNKASNVLSVSDSPGDEAAELAHQRDVEAHRRELRRHYEGLGDVEAHQRAAEREREAARRDLRAAQEADRQDT